MSGGRPGWGGSGYPWPGPVATLTPACHPIPGEAGEGRGREGSRRGEREGLRDGARTENQKIVYMKVGENGDCSDGHKINSEHLSRTIANEMKAWMRKETGRGRQNERRKCHKNNALGHK